MKAVVFSGGRGCTNIIKSIIRQTELDLAIVVNAYDNGKSTGRIRAYIPGLLGPSDIRKNVSVLLECFDSLVMANFLEFRLASNLGNLPLIDLIQESNPSIFNLLTFEQYQSIKLALDYFEQYQIKIGRSFDTFGCAIGNIILASLFLQYEKNFNFAIAKYQEIFLVNRLTKNRNVQVLNVTDGENLYLIARSTSGKIFLDESEIVVNENMEVIREIALVKDLNERSVQVAFDNVRMPNANPIVIHLLKTMDILIYGPGTQASSLLPSYLTSEVLNEISRNSSAKKIFVSNLVPDLDDPVSNVFSRLDTFFLLANLVSDKLVYTELVTNVFSELELSESSNNLLSKKFPGIVFQTDNWLIENNKHLGAAIVRQISQACEKKLKFKPGLVSVLVFDFFSTSSYAHYLDVLESLQSSINVDSEILIIANDRYIQNLQKQVISLKEEALLSNQIRFVGSIHEALLKSRGDVVAYLGSTQLYELSDLFLGIRLLIDNDKCHFVLGSRNLRIFDLRKQIREAYPTQPIRGFISYWGSLVISISFLLKFKRFITDPLSGIKIFKKANLGENDIYKISQDIDINLIKYFIKAGLPIQQFDIGFNTNSLTKNNRHRYFSGIKSLLNIWHI